MENRHEKKKRILKLHLGSERVILRISCLGLGLSILGLGNNIIDRKSSLCTLGLWQGFNLLALAFVLESRTILASPLALGRLSLLALVTGLTRPFGNFRRRKRGLGGGRLVRKG